MVGEIAILCETVWDEHGTLNEAPTLWSGKSQTVVVLRASTKTLNEAPTLWSGKSAGSDPVERDRPGPSMKPRLYGRGNHLSRGVRDRRRAPLNEAPTLWSGKWRQPASRAQRQESLNEAPTLWSGKLWSMCSASFGLTPLNEAPTLWSGKS